MKRTFRQSKASLSFCYLRGAGYWPKIKFPAYTLYHIPPSYVIHEVGFRVARSVTCD